VEKFVVTTKVWERKLKEIATCFPPNYATPMSGTLLWIWILSDPKLLVGSGSGKNASGTEQLWIRNEIEVKLL
jgi:hypothetical protein